VLKCTEECQCNVVTVLCCNGVSTNGLRGLKMVAQMLSMRKEQDQQLKETVHASLSLTPKLFILWAYRRLCDSGPSASKSKETMLKNGVLIRSLHL
jgi:hypothetical protein